MKTKAINKNFFNDLKPEYEALTNMSVEISDRIEEILKAKGITQREFADLLGKSESEVSKWMSGMHNFTLKSIARIETVLGEKVIQTVTRGDLNQRSPAKLIRKSTTIKSVPGRVISVKNSKRMKLRYKPVVSTRVKS
jgi:transcriptional regulator with XRE-family HTH domain